MDIVEDAEHAREKEIDTLCQYLKTLPYNSSVDIGIHDVPLHHVDSELDELTIIEAGKPGAFLTAKHTVSETIKVTLYVKGGR